MCWLPPVSRTTKKTLTRILSRSFSQMSATSLQHQDVLKPSTSLTSEVSTRWAVGTAWRMASLVIFCRQLFCRQSGSSNVPTKWGFQICQNVAPGRRACSQGACFLVSFDMFESHLIHGRPLKNLWLLGGFRAVDLPNFSMAARVSRTSSVEVGFIGSEVSGFWILRGFSWVWVMTISDEKTALQFDFLPLKRWGFGPQKRNVIRQFVFQSSFLGGYVDFRWRFVMVMMVNDGGDDGGDDGDDGEGWGVMMKKKILVVQIMTIMTMIMMVMMTMMMIMLLVVVAAMMMYTFDINNCE